MSADQCRPANAFAILLPMSSVLPREPLHVLHLEDSPPDHELALAHLLRGGLLPEVLRVDSEASFRAALADGHWDVVLSDFNLPGFDGLRAQCILKDSGLELPFILVSGEIGEDAAVAAMRNGASDYLLKNNLSRLAPAVEHAVAANRERLARQRADRDLAASRQRLAELARHLQTSVEMERAAIAREIHDDVGGSLTAIKFDLAWLARHLAQPEMLQRIAGLQDLVDHAVESSQRIMHNLRPAILDQGLVPALQWLGQQYEKRHSINCMVRSSHDAMALPSGVPLVAYRFAQEALTNVTKHAQASQVTVDLSLARRVLSVEVSDNGKGLAPGDLAKARSFGLRGLQERAATVGGWVDVSSTSGAGTVVMLSVPLRGQGQTGASGDGSETDFDQDADHDPTGWGTP